MFIWKITRTKEPERDSIESEIETISQGTDALEVLGWQCVNNKQTARLLEFARMYMDATCQRALYPWAPYFCHCTWRHEVVSERSVPLSSNAWMKLTLWLVSSLRVIRPRYSSRMFFARR